MRKKDRMIRDAFAVYQAAEEKEYRQKEQKKEDFYTEGFEDKIYQWIQNLPIQNPREKAHRIWLALLSVLIVCIGTFFVIYHGSQKSARATAQIEKIYEQAAERMEKLSPGTQMYVINDGDSSKLYQIQILNSQLEKKLQSSDVSYQREKKLTFLSVSSCAQYLSSGTGYGETVCYQSYAAQKWTESQMMTQQWKGYTLSDRQSKQYYILKKTSGEMAIAKYCGISLNVETKKKESVQTILKDVFGIRKADDVRSISLERYQAKSEAEPDRLIEAYVKKEAKQQILSYFGKDSVIHDIGNNNSEHFSKPDSSWQPIEKLHQKGWDSAVKLVPKQCYYLGIENQYHETYLMGIVKEGEKVQIFVDQKRTDTIGFSVQLSEETQKQIAEWIDKAKES